MEGGTLALRLLPNPLLQPYRNCALAYRYKEYPLLQFTRLRGTGILGSLGIRVRVPV